jgi:lipopolysaccharide transport system ATP-binding protein
MSSDAVIRVSQLSKCYHIFDRPRDRLLQMLFRGRRCFFREFWALRDVSLEVAKGEVIGIIGKNGSGKSTLLQLICGTLAPSSGEVSVKGRVAALLELGSGFNPEFTGLDNVFLNASILGLTRQEIERRLDQILAFADIGNFVHEPVKTYSSGMYTRLAFAVSVCVDPDILIVDEILSVGDVLFQAKCFRRFQSLVNAGTTILFVSHSTEQIVRNCSRAVLMESGRLAGSGSPRSIVNCYLEALFGTAKREEDTGTDTQPTLDAPVEAVGEQALLNGVFEQRPGYNKHEYRWGDGTARIRDFVLTRENESTHRTHFDSCDRISLAMRIEFLKECAAPIFGLIIKTPDGVTLYANNSRDVDGGPLLHPVAAGCSVIVVFKLALSIGQGDYLLSVGVAEDDGTGIVPKDRRYDGIHIHVSNPSKSFGLTELGMECSISTIGTAVAECA